MENVALERFKQILETMLADLERPLRRREGIAIENTPDALDEVQNAAEREFAIRQLEQQSGRFRDVKAALQRIEEGTYGACLHCESDISLKRLNAVPWAAYCLTCQDLADQKTAETEPDFVQITGRGPKVMRAGQSIKTDGTPEIDLDGSLPVSRGRRPGVLPLLPHRGSGGNQPVPSDTKQNAVRERADRSEKALGRDW